MAEISIVIPAYNAGKFLRNCLDSVLSQSFTDWECIIVNDGSTDDTSSIVRQYIAQDSRFRLVEQDNAGAFAARIRGVDESISPWVTFIDSDDTVDDVYLEKLHSLCNEDRDIIISLPVHLEVKESKFSIEDYRFKTIIGYPIEPGMVGKFYRRSLFDGIDSYLPKSIRLGEDLIMNVRLAFRITHEVSVHPEYHYNYRFGINSDSVTRQFKFSPDYYQRLTDYIRESIPESLYNRYKSADLQRRIGNLELFCGYKVKVPNEWWNSDFRKNITRDVAKFGSDIPWIHRLLLTHRNPYLRQFLIICRKAYNRIGRLRDNMWRH